MHAGKSRWEGMPARPSRAWWPSALVAAACWVVLFNQLRIDWSLDPQYSYGWIVPIAAAGLFWKKWTSRPPADNRESRLALLATIGLLAILLPIRLIEEANPEWRLALWLHAIDVSAVSALVLFLAGGKKWLWHFGFCAVFPLVAVPWPKRLESELVVRLMSWVTAATVEIADWIGIPALSNGNLIETSSGIVGVAEACSGVQSLQASIVSALLFGELFRMAVSRRLILIAGSIVLAIVVNLGRTLLMVGIAYRSGVQALDRWHDAAGSGAILAIIVGLGIITRILQKGPLTRPGEAVETSGLLTARSTRASSVVFASGILWLCLVEAATELWFRAHEPSQPAIIQASLSPELDMNGWIPLDLPESVRAILRCDDWRSFAWSQAGGQWRLFYFRWPPGRNSSQLAKGHSPEICFRGTGYSLQQRVDRFRISARDREIPVQQFVFRRGNETLHVFYSLWDDRPVAQSAGSEDGSQFSRLAAVWSGRRNLGQQALTVAVRGPDSPEEARKLFRLELQNAF